MRFNNDELKTRYWTLRNYLEKRCETLESTISYKYNCYCCHTNSSAYGFSNYIEVEKPDESDTITIRISDHNPTGSGDDCDYYVYINNRDWKMIKIEIMKIVDEFMKGGK